MSAVPPAGPAAGCPPAAVLPAPGASAGGASPPGAASAAAGVHVSAMPGLLPLMRVVVPFFSCASRACRAAAVLIPACPAMTATVAPAGAADSAARTAAAGLSPAARATGAGAGSVAAPAALRAAYAARFLVRAMMMTPFPILRRDSRFHLPAPCLLDDNCSGPAVKSNGPAAITDTVFPPGPRSLSLTATESITVRPRTFPAAPAAFPRLPSPGRMPSPGQAGTGLRARDWGLVRVSDTDTGPRTGHRELTCVTHLRRATDDCFTSCARI